MDYEIDLKTKLKGPALAAKWHEILDELTQRLYTIPTEQRAQQHDEQMDTWCNEIATKLGFAYHRNGNWLCFADPELAAS
jgi:hypothetical protein